MTEARASSSPQDRRTAVLLTGATGFLGMELLGRWLERTDVPVYALVRGEDGASVDARLRRQLAADVDPMLARSERLNAVPGDIQAPQLGLDGSTRDRLAGEVGCIVHAAASVSFALPLPEARAINVEGTRRVLEFAAYCNRDGGLQRLCYISTAYVAGTYAGSFGEDELDVGQGFRNAYEQSKYEAERIVRDHSDRLPVQILRPSIIVGERASGWTRSFNVLYPPLKAFARGLLPALPAKRSAPVDVVPVDYVADAAFALANGPPEDNRTYNLVAGGQATTVGRLIDLSARLLRRSRPLVLPPPVYRRVLHPLLKRRVSPRRREALEQMEAFFPYFSMRTRYRDERARRRLDSKGVHMTPVENYYPRLLDFALRASWGRRLIARTHARAQARPGHR